MTNKIIAVQGNNLNNLNPLTDTSIFLAKSGENRGYKIFYYEPENLSIKNKKVFANGSFIKIDLSKLLIFKNKKPQKINNTEKVILQKMINSPGQTFSREDIAKIIKLEKERSIDVIITRLRKKIEKDSKNPRYLQTKRGEGYVLWIE